MGFETQKAPKPPKYKGLIKAQKRAADQQADYAQQYFQQQQQQFEWAKLQYEKDREISNEVIERSMKIYEDMAANAAEDRERYKAMFQPLEDALIKEAKEYASPERVDMEMGRAQAGVAQNYDAMRRQHEESLASYGVDPGQAKFKGMDIAMRTQQAADMAGAGNMARDQTEAMARALRSEAINVGRGYPTQSMQGYAGALGAGNQAVNSGLATTASGANTMGTPVQWGGLANQGMGLANQGFMNAANMQNLGFGNAYQSWYGNQQASSGLGTMIGAGLGLGMRFMGFDDGGMVPDDEAVPTSGGNPGGGPVGYELSPSAGAITDDIPARLNAGEFVMPREAVSWLGEKFFHNLIAKSQTDREKMIAQTQAIPDDLPAIPEEPAFVSGGIA